MNCELCGAKGELFRAVVEGAQIKICEKCGRFGKVLGKVMPEQNPGKRQAEKQKEKPEKTLAMVSGYGGLIRKRREQLGLTQDEFARKLAEKESIIHKIEVESIEPSIELAAKLEKVLGVKLAEEREEETKVAKPKKDELTIGDFVKVRKR